MLVLGGVDVFSEFVGCLEKLLLKGFFGLVFLGVGVWVVFFFAGIVNGFSVQGCADDSPKNWSRW